VKGNKAMKSLECHIRVWMITREVDESGYESYRGVKEEHITL
jgi:hypothetical protein